MQYKRAVYDWRIPKERKARPLFSNSPPGDCLSACQAAIPATLARCSTIPHRPLEAQEQVR